MKLFMPIYVIKYEDDGCEKTEYFEDRKEFIEMRDILPNTYGVKRIHYYQGTLEEIDE